MGHRAWGIALDRISNAIEIEPGRSYYKRSAMALIRYDVHMLALTLKHPLRCCFISNLNPQILGLKAMMFEGCRATALSSDLPSSFHASRPSGFIAFCFTPTIF
jgi:hypothetical protein